MKKKLYIGCALTHLPENQKQDFLLMIPRLKAELEKNFEILEFKSSVHDFINNTHNFTPKEIYECDIKNCVLKADYLLALCDFPSLGLGYEIATAVEKQGIPVLAVSHTNNFVSRLIRGIDHPKFKFTNYNTMEDIVEESKKFFT